MMGIKTGASILKWFNILGKRSMRIPCSVIIIGMNWITEVIILIEKSTAGTEDLSALTHTGKSRMLRDVLSNMRDSFAGGKENR